MGAGVLALAQWAVPTLIARHLGPEAVGEYGLAVSLVVPIALLVGGQLRGLVAADHGRAYAVKALIAFRVIGTALGTVLLVGIGAGLAAIAPAVLWIGLGRLTDLWLELVYGIEQRSGKFRGTIAAQISRGVILIACTAFVLNAGGDVVAAGKTWTAVSVAVLVVIALPSVFRVLSADQNAFSSRYGGRGIARGLRLVAGGAVPLAVVQLIFSVTAYLPRYFLAVTDGLREIGTYTAAYTLLSVATPVLSAVGQLITPQAAGFAFQGDVPGLRRLRDRFLFVYAVAGGILVVVAWQWGDRLLEVIFGSAFGGHGLLLTAMAVAVAINFLNSLHGYLLTAIGVHKPQVWSAVVVLASGLAAGVLLIPMFGLIGAAGVLICQAGIQLFTLNRILTCHLGSLGSQEVNI